jgi:dihydroxyacetone kinase-like predicted kinase
VDARVYDGQTLKQAFKSGEDLLEKRIEEINNLNVYPVPDGDTGINMYLTLQSANEAIKDTTSRSASEVASLAANGALLGARGNSGVIFSQIMLGLARGLANKDQFTAIDFAQALLNASENAYKALLEPVEGTILTVIRESAEMAVQKARGGANLQQTIAALTSQAKATVTRTPEMLPVLKEAGVVDAGGKGLFYFFQGMKNFMVKKMNPVEGYKAVRRRAARMQVESIYGYDLQFLIEGQNMPVDEIRSGVCAMGESVLV